MSEDITDIRVKMYIVLISVLCFPFPQASAWTDGGINASKFIFITKIINFEFVIQNNMKCYHIGAIL